VVLTPLRSEQGVLLEFIMHLLIFTNIWIFALAWHHVVPHCRLQEDCHLKKRVVRALERISDLFGNAALSMVI